MGMSLGVALCAEVRFSVLVNLSMRTHTHTHTHDHMWMHEYSESFFYRHTSFCLLAGALGLIRPNCPTWTESIQDNG